MSVDTLSNILSAIKNSYLAGRTELEVMHTKEAETVAKILKDEGYLSEVKVFKLAGKPYKGIHIELKKDAISDIKRVSKPGRRVYQKAVSLGAKGKPGLLVVSTPRGIMTSHEARKRKLGGEVLCLVW